MRTSLFTKYMAEFGPYFRKVAQIMAENHEEKGDSWKSMSWAYLMDNLSKQFEDMENEREDYYANIGCYAGMLWLKKLDETGDKE